MKATTESIRSNAPKMPQEGRVSNVENKRKMRDRLLRMIIKNELSRKGQADSEK